MSYRVEEPLLGGGIIINQLNGANFKSEFSLKDFLVEKLKEIVDMSVYDVEAYDEQLESYENSKNNSIILIVKALNGISYNDRLSVPYQVLVFTPEIQSENDDDPIKMMLDKLNELANSINGNPFMKGLSRVEVIMQTPMMMNPLVAENIQFRGMFYVPVQVKESYDVADIVNVCIDGEEVKINNIIMSDVTVGTTTTNSATNKQDSVSKNKTKQMLITIICDIKYNSLFHKLRDIRHRMLDINTLFVLEIRWTDNVVETFNVIESQSQVIIDKITGNNSLQIQMLGSE